MRARRGIPSYRTIAVLAWFVAAGWLEQDAATSMLGWPHSGFGALIGQSQRRRRLRGGLDMRHFAGFTLLSGD